MTPMFVGLALCAISLIVIAAAAVLVLARMLRVRAALAGLQSHPVTLLAPRAQLLLAQTADWGDRIAIIEPRVRAIARNASLLLAASAVLRHDVHAIGRATEGMLATFVPRLRGSL